jgi:hypothetical protein
MKAVTINQTNIISIIQSLPIFASPNLDNSSHSIMDENTLLISDLGLNSVDFVVIFEKIQAISKERINFLDLIMPDRCTYVNDLTIKNIADFVNNSAPTIDPAKEKDPYKYKRELITYADIDMLDGAIKHQIYRPEVIETKTQLCFILSAPRSGSTLLRKMLGCHPNIYAPMELHLMSYQDYSQRNDELNTDDHAHLLEGTIVARQEIRGIKREVSSAVDQMYTRDKRNVTQFFKEIDPHIKEKILIDKTPTYAFSLATLERLKLTFPQAKFIHLVRKPNAVIKSLIDADLGQLIRFQKTSGISSGRFAEALWCICEKNIQAALTDSTSQSIKLNFEDLVTNPKPIIEKLQCFLEVEPFVNFNPYIDLSTSKEKINQFAGDLKTYLHNSIDPKTAFEWKNFNSLCELSPPTEDLLKAGQSQEENLATLHSK